MWWFEFPLVGYVGCSLAVTKGSVILEGIGFPAVTNTARVRGTLVMFTASCACVVGVSPAVCARALLEEARRLVSARAVRLADGCSGECGPAVVAVLTAAGAGVPVLR